MNGASACAASIGFWKRCAGSFAIIFAATAASSAGASARTCWRGVASVDTWRLQDLEQALSRERRAPVSRKYSVQPRL